MKQHAVNFLVTAAAALAAQLLATYLINNVRTVRNLTGPL